MCEWGSKTQLATEFWYATLHAWDSGPKTTIGKLFVAQKKIVTAITFSKSKDHSAPLIKSCNMLNIFDINKYIVSTFVYKCVKGRISLCED